MNVPFDPAQVTSGSFDHPVEALRLIETHISWVFLTGRFAYKIKKPVNLDFLDFHTLDQRKYFCECEFRLNRKLAPQIYLAVVPVGGTAAQPRFGVSPAFEYAVKMHQFPQHELLDHQLAEGRLQPANMKDLGRYIATLHMRARRVDESAGFGKIRSVSSPIAMNYRTLGSLPLSAAVRKALQKQCERDFAELRRLRPVLSQRFRDGFVRDCHGDLHLGNLVSLNGQIIAFDRLEFDPALRWIDVMNEAAFPFMDLIYTHHEDLAFAYMNAYVELTGDYAGLTVLPLYAAYKAIIRAKVSACDTSGDAHTREVSVAKHIACADRLSQHKTPRLLIMHGLSCSGKSWIANALKCSLPAIRLRADVERKRLAGLTPLHSAAAKPGTGLYSAATTHALYQQLRALAQDILGAGFNVIVDATFLATWQRNLFQSLAEDTGQDLVIVDCQAPLEVLRDRLARRSQAVDDPSDADATVLAWQVENAMPLSDAEKAQAIVINSSNDLDVAAIIDAI